ncbi:MAG: MC/SLC25 family protein, partial [Terriglobus roseus]|nr:MC/SLC25 family protein [Terriglobus roseus]
MYPIDTLKFRVQTETVKGGQHGNALILSTALKMWRQGGVRVFYRGLPAGLGGMFPYAAIDLGTFEFLKGQVTARNARRLGCHEEDAAPGAFATAAMGGFSGALGASLALTGVLLFVGVLFQVRLGLRPLGRLRDQLAEVRAGRLDRLP